MENQPERVVLDRDDLRRTLVRIAHEIVEKNPRGRSRSRSSASTPAGRCWPVACTRSSASSAGAEVPLGDLDISFYRDDIGDREPGAQPVVHSSHLDFDLDGRTVVLVDDVLFTGRTARAAIDALFDYGRPERVQLAVLADRGHRELPDPPRLRRQEPADGARRARLRPPRGDRRRRRGDDRAGRRPGAERGER